MVNYFNSEFIDSSSICKIQLHLMTTTEKRKFGLQSLCLDMVSENEVTIVVVVRPIPVNG